MKDTTKKLQPEQWLAARVLWESDVKMSFADVAAKFGCTKQAVHSKSKTEGWRKVGADSRVIAGAHSKADAAMQEIEASPLVVRQYAESEIRGATEEIAIDIRSKVLERHRKEWDGPRSLIYDGMRTKDNDKVRLGKTSAEALKIIQDGERRAFGLDTSDAPKIIIERR